MIKLTKHLKKIVAISVFVLVANTFLNTGTASAARVDLKQYYPNPALYKNYYLEGSNYKGDTYDGRSVLWFEDTDSTGNNYRRYNTEPSDPASRCGWDALSWADDKLTYSQTHDGCGGHNKDVIYSNPIQFLPRYWEDDTQDWVFHGSTPVETTKHDGTTGCKGVNTYTSTVLAGRLNIGDGLTAIHWVTEQNTQWSEGDDFPWCIHDSTTPWREDYYMIEALPVEGYTGMTTAKALKRTVGGNLGELQTNGYHDWNIWFAKWVKLPWGTDPGVVDPPPPPPPGTQDNTPRGPKTGQIGIATVALAALGGLLFLSAMGVKKAYRKKKGLPATKPKVAKAPKPGKTPKTPKTK